MSLRTRNTGTIAKTVLITGSSSGIGEASALLMARNGFRVLAGVRKPEDGERLRQKAGKNITPVIIDVTDAASITTARAQVEDQIGSGLDGLVNVAGIGVTGPLEYATAEEMHRVFEINVFGQIAVIQAFLPMIRDARGRIVNISSVGAHIAIPFGGLLSASKSAFGSLSDALRLELRPFGIRVCVIEPGAIATPAVDKTLGDVEGVIARLPPEASSRYGQMLRNFNKRAYAREKNGSPPAVVAKAIHHALTASAPKIRYVVGKDARPLAILPRLLSDSLLDALRARIFSLPAGARSR
jgi:NAD(P)-dependent dehydrogenase (short-subunit alcohol dehydrogenase family)